MLNIEEIRQSVKDWGRTLVISADSAAHVDLERVKEELDQAGIDWVEENRGALYATAPDPYDRLSDETREKCFCGQGFNYMAAAETASMKQVSYLAGNVIDAVVRGRVHDRAVVMYVEQILGADVIRELQDYLIAGGK